MMRSMAVVIVGVAVLGLFGPGGVVAQSVGATPVIGVELGVGSHSAGAKFRGVLLNGARAYGTAEDLARVIADPRHFDYALCNCLFSAVDVGACMVSKGTKVAVPMHLQGLPRGRVVIVLSNGNFAVVFNAVTASKLHAPAPKAQMTDLGSPPSPPPPPTVVPPAGALGGTSGHSACDKPCDPASSVDFGVDGETTFTVGCENGLAIEASTSGDVNVKVGSSGVTMSVPISSP